MGAGTYPFGYGPFGHNPVQPVSSQSSPSLVDALTPYDPSIRGFSVQLEGEPGAGVHPVVQEVSLALCVELGAIPSSPLVGLNVKRIRASRADTLNEVARDEVTRSLSRLIEARDIALDEVLTERVGFIKLEVRFRNLRAPNFGPLTITLQG